ncbi:MAG TPA: DNA polymerase ligase N-terminal domain-containing protein, partial [Dongiaceae bacterium]|nr:DNA polymerase ligase N-terminal domain-containing protein [Dongiaceae bacterium]
MEKLKEYHRKRDFRKTLEPAGAANAVSQGCLYVMHKHAASHDHFDLRLEQDGVLRSWALPKGPSLKAGEKRLAVEVEDHPLEYGGFEGVIPKHQYGGGTVMLWDAGSWHLNGKDSADHLDFVLEGRQLHGAWSLVKMKKRSGSKGADNQWLLIKRSDHPPQKLNPQDISIASGRTMEEIAADRYNHWMLQKQTQKTKRPNPKSLSGARKAAMPAPFAPQLATLVAEVPQGQQWLHELKYDGYRLLAYID